MNGYLASPIEVVYVLVYSPVRRPSFIILYVFAANSEIPSPLQRNIDFEKAIKPITLEQKKMSDGCCKT